MKPTRSKGLLLPLTAQRPSSSVGTHYIGFIKRRWRPAVVVVFLIYITTACFSWMTHSQWASHQRSAIELREHANPSTPAVPALPPLYEEYRAQENHLPHYEEYARTDVKYLWADNYAHASGWGNVMQDFLVMSLVAHVTNRSHVFNDYVWDLEHSPYSVFNGNTIPSRIPLSAIAGGSMVGGPMPPDDRAPRAVSASFFHKVCPNPTVLNVRHVHEGAGFDGSETAWARLRLWFDTLTEIDDPCVQLEHYSPAIFDYMLYGNKKQMLPIWPYLSKTPAVAHWQWSPLVLDAFKTNSALFTPRPTMLSSLSRKPALESRDPIPGLLAIHVRRGDFEDHCRHLAQWSSDWNAFNGFPEFVDAFEVPPVVGWGETTPENVAVYERRCFPDIAQIVERVARVRREWRGKGAATELRRLFILTNGPRAWVDALKRAFLEEPGQGWEGIASSRDLELSAEQKYVAQAVDMLVAERAEVFIGNGWSSLTSNVNVLRMAKKFRPDSCRFW